jgi:hypothetical protein
MARTPAVNSKPEVHPTPTELSKTRVPAEPPVLMGPMRQGEMTRSSGGLNFTRNQLILAVAIAAASDGIGLMTKMIPPLEWAVDLVTAALLFAVLGWQWLLLPGLILEALPGIGVIPFWLLVVGAIAVWGTARPKLK